VIPAPLPPETWVAEGARVAERVTGVSAVVVIGREPEVTALVARGIASVASAERAVAIADLIGGIPALTVPREVPGLRECFRDGDPVSDTAQPLEDLPQVFILPQGAARLDAYALAGHPRWGPLIAGFRRTEGLLLIVALAGTDGLDALIGMTDGAVAVDLPPVLLRQWPLVATVDRPEELPPIVMSEAGRTLLEERAQAGVVLPVAPPTPPTAPTPRSAAIAALRRPRTAAMVVGGVTLATLGALWLSRGPGRALLEALRVPAPTVATADTLAWADTAVRADIPIDTITLGAVVNPQDSIGAAAFTVQLVAANSVAGANSSLVRRGGSPLPAATIAPVQLDVDGRTWYRALVGAWQDPAEAARFLETLRRDGTVDAAAGRVLRAPYALQLAEGMAVTEVPAALARWSRLGIAAYALAQDDGRVRLLAGAFETPDQAAVLAVSLRDAGVPPVVVFRFGRTL
jgi:hypothetical protein